VSESTEKEFMSAVESEQYQETRAQEDPGVQSACTDPFMSANLQPLESAEWLTTLRSSVDRNDYVGLRLRGLPFSSTVEDIKFFFYDYKVIEESIKLGEN
jgi:hypothetical protein